MARIKGEIDRRLCTVVVSGTGDKGVRVGVAEKRAVRRFGNEIGIAFPYPFDPAAEFLDRRDGVFKRDGSVFNIRRVDRKQRRRVVRRCDAETEGSVCHRPHLSKPCTQSERR